MRVGVLLLAVTLVATASPQEPELIPAPYLSPQYAAPPGAPASIVVAGQDEPGDRLVVTGQTSEGTQSVADVSIYVFHTDVEGRYARDIFGPDAEMNPRLYGTLRTDGQGRYRYETIRPGSYNNNAAHVHYVVMAPGYKPRLLDLWFDDDPVLVARREAGEPEVPSGIRNSSVCRSAPDCVAIRPVVRDANGVWHTTRNIQMIRQ
jgi:hydroxyquinol 1,2-dioxygenase